jgi:uncharacterized SAM-binding protein YcdF (DUF218 family)
VLNELSWLKALLKVLVLPPTSLVLLALVALLASRRWPRAGRTIAAAALLGLVAMSLPIVAGALDAALSPPAPFTAAAAANAKAIVVLAGGARRFAAEYNGDTLSALSLERIRYGARIAKATGLPVLVSGGAPQRGAAEADLMRDVLEHEFGVPVRWVENASRNTHENAALSAAILRGADIRRVVMVTHGFDMRRATAEFAAQGIEAVPAATGLTIPHPVGWRDFVPQFDAFRLSYYAVYEILGNAAMGWGLAR